MKMPNFIWRWYYSGKAVDPKAWDINASIARGIEQAKRNEGSEFIFVEAARVSLLAWEDEILTNRHGMRKYADRAIKALKMDIEWFERQMALAKDAPSK